MRSDASRDTVVLHGCKPPTTLACMTPVLDLLALYDERLRTDAELVGAREVVGMGPFHVGVFDGGRGFVTYAHEDAVHVRGTVDRLMVWIHGRPDLREVEVKTRAHDAAPGLREALIASGFVPGEAESVMLGPADGLLGARPPAGVTVRRCESEAELLAAARMQDEVFGGDHGVRGVPELVRRTTLGDGPQVWVADQGGVVVSAGRIEPIAGTGVAGIWGGATLASHRHRGIYRALTSARVASVMVDGVAWIHSDSTDYSRPILERAGLTCISHSTPYAWTRRPASA